MKVIRINCQLNYVANTSSDFIFNIQAGHHDWQKISNESITINPQSTPHYAEDHDQNRLIIVNDVIGSFSIHYQAEIEVNYPQPAGNEAEIAVAELPTEAIPYIRPSRYCESDHLAALASRTFGQLPKGYSRVMAICEWVHSNIFYQPGMSKTTKSAVNTLELGIGNCKDFAHLAISFCRALNMPARYVTGYADHAGQVNDFHAIFEVYLGNRWILFDATTHNVIENWVRISTGRDASDCALSTIFGKVDIGYVNPEVTVMEKISHSAPQAFGSALYQAFSQAKGATYTPNPNNQRNYYQPIQTGNFAT